MSFPSVRRRVLGRPARGSLASISETIARNRAGESTRNHGNCSVPYHQEGDAPEYRETDNTISRRFPFPYSFTKIFCPTAGDSFPATPTPHARGLAHPHGSSAAHSPVEVSLGHFVRARGDDPDTRPVPTDCRGRTGPSAPARPWRRPVAVRPGVTADHAAPVVVVWPVNARRPATSQLRSPTPLRVCSFFELRPGHRHHSET